MREWPTLRIGKVAHVGAMDLAAKRTGSYEGDCLSVSFHPDAWSRIARLGGMDTWTLERGDGLFLDVLDLDDEQRDVIADWAVENGLCERRTQFEARQYDDELEADRVFTCATFEEALAELDLIEDGNVYVNEMTEEEFDADEVSEMITPVTGLVATPKLLEMMRQEASDRPVMGDLAYDFAIIAYSQKVLDVDGCWWAERLSPETLSAPRGGINPDRLANWSVRPALEDEWDDDVDMEEDEDEDFAP